MIGSHLNTRSILSDKYIKHDLGANAFCTGNEGVGGADLVGPLEMRVREPLIPLEAVHEKIVLKWGITVCHSRD